MTVFLNNLLELLPRKDRSRLLDISELVVLEVGEIFCEPGALLQYVYFPKEASISLLASIDGHRDLEVGVVGSEGMLGAHVALGVETAPVQASVCSPGDAWRVGVPVFRNELARSSKLQRSLGAYLTVLMTELTTAVGCCCFHEVGPRLARRLLMAHDLARANRFAVTQDSLAEMLGVRRSSISVAAGILQRSGLIAYHRGELTVLKRKGLESAACSCYGANRRTYHEAFD